MRNLIRFIIALAVASAAWACTEPNPDYDPDFVPPCSLGTVRCSEDLSAIEACQDSDDTRVYVETKTCWESTVCGDGVCGPDNAPACSVASECAEDLVCTALPMSRDELGTFCIPPPNELGTESGKACSTDAQCLSGYCFRRTCFTPCTETTDCPYSTECVELSVTIDGIQGKLLGCAIPD